MVMVGRHCDTAYPLTSWLQVQSSNERSSDCDFTKTIWFPGLKRLCVSCDPTQWSSRDNPAPAVHSIQEGPGPRGEDITCETCGALNPASFRCDRFHWSEECACDVDSSGILRHDKSVQNSSKRKRPQSSRDLPWECWEQDFRNSMEESQPRKVLIPALSPPRMGPCAYLMTFMAMHVGPHRQWLPRCSPRRLDHSSVGIPTGGCWVYSTGGPPHVA